MAKPRRSNPRGHQGVALVPPPDNGSAPKTYENSRLLTREGRYAYASAGLVWEMVGWGEHWQDLDFEQKNLGRNGMVGGWDYVSDPELVLRWLVTIRQSNIRAARKTLQEEQQALAGALAALQAIAEARKAAKEG